jgi:hypothetical protein
VRGQPHRVDGVAGAARGVAALRVVLGAVELVRPGAARPWVGRSATGPAGTVLGRAAGVRDVVLGAGVLAAAWTDPRAERAWVVAGAVCDAVDAATTAAAWRRLPAGRWLVAGAAVTAAAVGALAARGA